MFRSTLAIRSWLASIHCIPASCREGACQYREQQVLTEPSDTIPEEGDAAWTGTASERNLYDAMSESEGLNGKRWS